MSGRRARLWLGGAVLLAIAGVVALLGPALGRDPAHVASPLVGGPAPDFALPGLNGPALRLSRLRGQVVVVNFWASWCADCRIEQPALNRTWQRFRRAGVVVLGVDFQDDSQSAIRFLNDAGVSYPVVADRDSTAALAWGLRGVPQTFIVDQAGRITTQLFGSAGARSLARRIAPLLGKRAR